MDSSQNTNDMLGGVIDKVKNVKEQSIVIVLAIMIVGIIVSLVIFYYRIFTLEDRKCDQYDEMYPSVNSHMRSIDNSESFKFMFRDYYIKTAANCCSTGKIKNSMVSTCGLRNVIKDGVRGLDFEIYSMDNQPVVGTSTLDKYTVKEVYNRVYFKDALGVIINYAFSRGSCPNPDDPIVIHLRFMSNNREMYENMADIFKQHENRLLGNKYNFENNYENFGETPLLRLKQKIVIAVCNTNKFYRDVKPFYKYVNVASGSMFMRYLTNTQVRNVPSVEELIKYNKQNMSIVIPDRELDSPNPGSVASRKMGIQLAAMQYQKNDTSLQEIREFFNRANTAFVLKPENLRFVQKYIAAPKKQDPKLSFSTRSAHAQGMKFDI
jgi:hypothetical protein